MDKQLPPKIIWGLHIEKWRELAAFAFILVGLFLFLSLVSSDSGRYWMGSLGNGVAFGLHFVIGRWIAYVLPVLLGLAAVHALQGSTPFHPLRKAISGLLILFSLCAILTLQYAMSDDADSRAASFQMGGLLGNSITNYEGLGMAYWCGPVGSVVICLSALFVGVMLSTDFLFVPLIHAGAKWFHALVSRLRKPAPVATLRFERAAGPGAFPVTAVERAEGRKDDGLGGGEPVFTVASSGPILSGFAEVEDEESPAEKAATKRARDKREKPVVPAEMIQTELDFSSDDFTLPPVSLLSDSPRVADPMDREEVIQVSNELEQALGDFNISARVVQVTQGPVVTRYELQPAPGIKVSRIVSLENDIALVLKAKSVRIQAPIPGKAAIGIEVPNRKVSPVFFKDLLSSEEFRTHPSPLAFALGKNISAEPVICDLAEMPHLLIAGTTGSGKSVCINVIITSILYRMPPDKVKFIMIDPKRVELNVYSDIPYLLAPVVNEPRQAAAALAWAASEMDERLQLFSELKVRNIASYNSIVSGKHPNSKSLMMSRPNLKYMPHIVIVIDELADLMLVAKNEVEEFVIRLAQMSRAAGIHMIIATQRPSVNVITGIIKANFPSRIAFRVSAKVDSRTILDMNGAETLLGRGDMLFCPGGVKPMRVQGAFLSDSDVEVLTTHMRAQNPATGYEQESFAMPEPKLSGGDGDGGLDESEENAPVSRRGPSFDRPSSPSSASSHPSRPPSAAPMVEFPSIPLKEEMGDDEDLYDKALKMVLETGKPSVSMIQRRMKIGFARAGRLMDLMEERGIVGPYQGSKPRDLLVDAKALLRRLDEIEQDKKDGI